MKRKIVYPEMEKVVNIRNLIITFGDRKVLSVRVDDREIAKIRERVDENTPGEIVSFIKQAEEIAGQIFDKHLKGRIHAEKDPEVKDSSKKKSGKKKG